MDKGFDRLLRTWKAHASGDLSRVLRDNLRENRGSGPQERFVMKNTVGIDRSAMVVPNWEFAWWSQ